MEITAKTTIGTQKVDNKIKAVLVSNVFVIMLYLATVPTTIWYVFDSEFCLSLKFGN